MNSKRARPPLALAWNPIVFALGQVVISAVLELERYVPALQERLRRSGYPLFERVDLQEVRMGPTVQPEFRQETKWVFSSKDRTRAAVVGPQFIVLEQTRYSTFDDFIDELNSVLAIVNEVLDIAAYQRLGFRRVNLLEETSSLPLSDVLREGIQGIDHDLFSGNSEQRYELWGSTPVGRMMVRLMRPAPETVIPPELMGTTLPIEGAGVAQKLTATLDVDHFQVETADFIPSAVIESFWSLHDASDRAFRAAVSEHALQTWKKEG